MERYYHRFLHLSMENMKKIKEIMNIVNKYSE